ncbi:tRNA (32-2'-O)-methyltransferase regulator THADA [Plodia interpunctella]|uniref:tRNA (32-2'-O)-methyltransferase regulator THADA n=1 Tax=Plodia interpunctella TaxID=58824 RepID=UPI002367D34C|nr:thyroid adenoma-associated protein homolog [Plodia interpunctella]
MNGLSLRIVRGGMKKSKNLIGFPPVHIETSFFSETGDNEVFKNFANASHTDEQLAILKQILLGEVNKLTVDDYKFLVAVFLLAEAKHPVKCFITRHITKTECLQQPFSEALANQIKSYSLQTPTLYTGYMDVVTKLSACLENFPAGAASLKVARVELAGYLVQCLNCCIKAVSEQSTLSPTEKNEVFSLCHLTLRLILHIIQKGSEDQKLDFIFEDIRLFIQQLVSHDDVPMDTKSLAGILCLTVYIVDNGPGSWADVLEEPNPDPCFTNLLSSDAGRMCLHSAVVSAIPAAQLADTAVAGTPVAVEVANSLIQIGERNSSDSPFTLGVTRALLNISKMLNPPSHGRLIMEALLPFVWGHLDHYMDSVRHLTADILKNIVRFCKKVHDEGDDQPLDELFGAVSQLDKHRKSYHVSVTLLAAALPQLQPAATLTLETLMKRHAKESSDTVYQQWLPVLQQSREALLAGDGALRDTILPHIRDCEADNSSSADLKSVLMLVSAVRKARVEVEPIGEGLWRGLVGYNVLRRAAVDDVDETRILSLSLIADSPRTTEPFESGELSLLLYHLDHVSHATPSFRQLLQAPLRKFMKRLEDSYKVLKRQKDNDLHIDMYQRFVEDLRSLCYGNLLRGANYSRRSLSLQILKWTEYLDLEGFERTWHEEYLERLLVHLEDSYENNKYLALEILQRCPIEMLQNKVYSVSLDLEDILREASSLKPTNCTSAAYKLELLRRRLPENIFKYQTDKHSASEPVSHALGCILLERLKSQLQVAERSIVRAARDGTMYGLLHCLGQLMKNVDVQAISNCESWRHLIDDIIDTSMSVCAAVACVVNNSSPEGHLPMDSGRVGVGDHGNNGGIVLEDGRPVTAQMVLLCAWRSVKEVSLLLGRTSALQRAATLRRAGAVLRRLLRDTKHRGAFEQAYVGFTLLLERLWRSREPSLHNLPRQWLQQLMDSIAMGDRKDATRRSAGLPFMIQALVTTEVQVEGNPKCFHHCMATLLRLAARERRDADTRVHCLNILRALFRNSALDESVAGYVGQGFVVALNGFEGDTWAERNASTLAFSALVSRAFGAPRPGHGAPRQHMTGRIFFLRYPQLYDVLMDILPASATPQLRPAVFPALVLLSRLWPSALEGSASSLRVCALRPRAALARSAASWLTRRLAADAVLPLVSPALYYTYIESLLSSIQQPTTHNHTHGVLLQLTRLLGAKPDDIPIQNGQALSEKLFAATWVLKQACGEIPDYVIADEFVKVLNMVIWRMPLLITEDLITFTMTTLESLLFNEKSSQITFGREICLSNAMYLLLILYTKDRQQDIPSIICNNVIYRYYDVTLSVLNYLLILHNSLEIECNFQIHIKELRDKNVLENLKKCPKYITTLCKIFEESKYLECIQKSLKVLTLEGNTQKYVVQIKTGINNLTDEIITQKLFELIENEHENLTHIYLECLSTFITEKLKEKAISMESMLDVVRVIFAHSTPNNAEYVREVVVKFLEENFVQLIEIKDGWSWSDQDKFEYSATLWCGVVALLEDAEAALRSRACALLRRRRLLPPAGRDLRGTIQGDKDEGALLVVFALLDFQSEVCMTDEISDECRVFDQNERHNVILEETIWSYHSAQRLRQIYSENTLINVLNICDNPTYRQTIDKLCNTNVTMFKKIANGGEIKKTAALNPKIELFIEQLKK